MTVLPIDVVREFVDGMINPYIQDSGALAKGFGDKNQLEVRCLFEHKPEQRPALKEMLEAVCQEYFQAHLRNGDWESLTFDIWQNRVVCLFLTATPEHARVLYGIRAAQIEEILSPLVRKSGRIEGIRIEPQSGWGPILLGDELFAALRERFPDWKVDFIKDEQRGTGGENRTKWYFTFDMIVAEAAEAVTQ